LSNLTFYDGELRGLRRAIKESLKNTNNSEEGHYFVKLKEIVDDILSVKDYDSKSHDLLMFICKDIAFLYET
jgi:hypothetical protein